eukprot:TRINITY_DN60190_c0_g1_i1.p1 TRINITY_DN60190_c0_g1~~TRINITY_DN60190_c0_g1_i1.p1  ORF type:complete len:147 (+),score=14.64 TRINITY_DN60190_c0_g1_i1:50-442(+)
MLLSAVRRGRIPREIVFAVAKGMYGRSKRCFKLAAVRVMKELNHLYKLRHRRKREMRVLWITRINPAAREHGLVYRRLISGLTRGNMWLDRKSLCLLAETEPVSFKCVVDETKRIMRPPRTDLVRNLSRF